MDRRKIVVLELLSRGNTREASYNSIRIAKATFYNWLKADQEFAECVTQAEAMAEVMMVNCIWQGAQKDWRAAVEFLKRRCKRGWGASEEYLAFERARSVKEERKAGVTKAQVKELLARARKSEMEAEMWPKQFVTEEEELNNLRAVAHAANKPLLMMTSDDMESIIKDRTPAEALEVLKERLGRSQEEIIQEVMKYKVEDPEAEDEEGDGSGADTDEGDDAEEGEDE
jgi:hypothetical protein